MPKSGAVQQLPVNTKVKRMMKATRKIENKKTEDKRVDVLTDGLSIKKIWASGHWKGVWCEQYFFTTTRACVCVRVRERTRERSHVFVGEGIEREREREKERERGWERESLPLILYERESERGWEREDDREGVCHTRRDLIKGKGIFQEALGFSTDSTKYRARTKHYQNEVPGKIFISLFVLS